MFSGIKKEEKDKLFVSLIRSSYYKFFISIKINLIKKKIKKDDFFAKVREKN